MRNRKKERDINAVGGKRERKTTTREGRDGGAAGDVCTLKYYSQMKYRAGPAGTQRAYIFRPYINTRIIMNVRARSLAPFSLPLCV